MFETRSSISSVEKACQDAIECLCMQSNCAVSEQHRVLAARQDFSKACICWTTNTTGFSQKTIPLKGNWNVHFHTCRLCVISVPSHFIELI